MTNTKLITEQDVDYIARLSRLKLNENEKKKMTEDMGKIVGYINKLNELNTDNVQPTSHAIPLENVTREDKVKPSLSKDEALANAPDKEGDYFKVPKLIE